MRAIFKTDFDLRKQIKVKSKHTGIKLFVTPRYIDHYVEHDYEAFSIEILQRMIGDYDEFVDIGAHYGYYALVAQKQNPALKLVAVEPVRENFVILKKNLQLMQAPFEAHNVAASNEKAEVTFNIIEASDSCGFYQHPLAEVKKTTTVQAEKLDNILEPNPKAFIKIDVEGHENKVLDGMTQVLKQKPTLLIEFNPDCQKMAGFEPETILKRLTKLGYIIYFLNEVSFEHLIYNPIQPKGWRKFIDEHGYCNILCITPSEKTKAKNIFDLLLVTKFIGVSNSKITDPTELLDKAEADITKKILELEKQKKATKAQLHHMVKTDYFKLWQRFVKLKQKHTK